MKFWQNARYFLQGIADHFSEGFAQDHPTRYDSSYIAGFSLSRWLFGD